MDDEGNDRREGYRLKRLRGGKQGYGRYAFTVPRRIAERLPEDGRYECVLVEEGVLYRHLPPEEAPKWLG